MIGSPNDGDFGDSNGSGNHVLADGVAEVRAHFGHDVIGQPRPRVVHRQHDGRDLEFRIQVARTSSTFRAAGPAPPSA